MRKLKNIIGILLAIVIIIFIIILILTREKSITEPESKGADVSQDYIKEIGTVDNYNTFFSVEKMLNNYINKIQIEDNIAVYNILDKTYIEKQNITQENVLNNLSHIKKYDSDARIRKIYSVEDMSNAVYYISCILENKNENKDFYFILYEDRKNSTYSIEPIDQNGLEKYINNSQENVEEKTIETNKDNTVLYKMPTEKERAERYFKDILDNILYYSEYAYNMLDTEYRTKCFPNIEDFKEYIEGKKEIYKKIELKDFSEFENMDEYISYLSINKRLELEEYQVKKEDGHTRYVCKDNYNNYYIFYATSPLQYTVILDTYSINIPEITKEYEKATERNKAVLNIKRFFTGIEDRNYGFSYSVLAEEFKNNKYPTKTDFINYAKQNFFEKNKIEYISYEKRNELYICKIKLSDATGKTSNQKTFNIIIKLNDDANFEMSFAEE